MDLSIFGTDKKLEEQGVWHDMGDSRLLVARFNNKRYTTRLRTLLKPFNALINAGGAKADEVIEKITVQCMAETILLGWEGALDDGEAIEYSTDNAQAMFKKYPDFKELIADLAMQAQHYRTATLEDIAKN